MNIYQSLVTWISKLPTPMKAALAGGAVSVVLTIAIFAPGGLLSRLTSPSEIEETVDILPPTNEQESAVPPELSPEKNEAFLVENGKKEGVKTTATGLQIRVLKPGTGKQPGPTSRVTVHYTGKLINGKVFDSSVGGEPITFSLNGVVAGWTEGLQLMKEGEKSELCLPQDLGYGEGGSGPIPPYQTLVFEVELLKVQ